MSFEKLGLHPALLLAVKNSGYTEPTPVQAAAIPPALAGTDLMVSSHTGSGKTAAFMLPALHRLATTARAGHAAAGQRGRGPRVLVLAPTRELALQVTKACETYGRGVKGLRMTSVLGGVPYGKQLQMLRGTLDVLVATPGRLLDHLNSGKLDLSAVEVLVLDEADRMLDMGFIDDIETIVKATPRERQTLMFSATFAGAIATFAAKLTRNPQSIALTSNHARHENITQRLHWADSPSHKRALLDRLLADPAIDQALVFTSTQRDADYLADALEADGHSVAALHGGMPQGKRNRTLQGLRTRRLRVLVATDVASRGIDVPTISHVINFGLPMNEEDYVHRIGRTGRAGRSGLAVTLADPRSAGMIRRIERFTAQSIPVATLEGLEPKLRSAPRELAGNSRPHGKPSAYKGKDSFRGRSGAGAKPGGSHKSYGAADKKWSSAPRQGRRP
jgi:superfamily II DNA/RNA helicase